MDKRDVSKLKKLTEEVSHPLDDAEIRKALGSGINIIPYNDLKEYNYFPFDRKGRLIVFFAVDSQYSGHWQCVLRYPDEKVIEYFDPYGIDPMIGCQSWMTKAKQVELGEDVNYAKILLTNEHDRGYKCVYNHHKFQNENDMNIQTCGRWCIVRLLFYKLTNEKFFQFISKMEKDTGLTGDGLITFVTTDKNILKLLK